MVTPDKKKNVITHPDDNSDQNVENIIIQPDDKIPRYHPTKYHKMFMAMLSSSPMITLK
jgi:hypothetical protein